MGLLSGKVESCVVDILDGKGEAVSFSFVLFRKDVNDNCPTA